MANFNDCDITMILNAVKTNPSEDFESDEIEFKAYKDETALHNSKDLTEEISALANFKGGLIIIGVKDNTDVPFGEWELQLAGIQAVDVHTTLERLRGKIQPKIDIRVKNFCYDAKNFVIISVPHPKNTLVSTSSGKTCIREGKSSRPMMPDELESAVKSLTSYDWSADCIDDLPLSVLDLEAVKDALSDFKSKRKIAEEINEPKYLEAIGATKNGYLTRAGLIYLGKIDSIRSILGDFEYRFSWKTKSGDLVLNEVWSNNIWNSIKKAKEYFNSCNSKSTYKYKENTFDVPLMDGIAFHEAYLNAMVHRDYSCEGMVSVNFTGDKLLITSPGSFYGGVNAENITRHEPRHRNKTLARLLMSHNLVDRAGMGVVRMGLHSLRYGRSFPTFRESIDSVEVSMQAQFLRSGIAVLYLDNKEKWGMAELIILNTVYGLGFVPINTIESQLSKLSDNPFVMLNSALENLNHGVELCGTNEGIYLKVKNIWKHLLESKRNIRLTETSLKHVNLYKYLRENKEASNTDITSVLGYYYSSQTSRFLTNAKYVKKGPGSAGLWSLSI